MGDRDISDKPIHEMGDREISDKPIHEMGDREISEEPQSPPKEQDTGRFSFSAIYNYLLSQQYPEGASKLELALALALAPKDQDTGRKDAYFHKGMPIFTRNIGIRVPIFT